MASPIHPAVLTTGRAASGSTATTASVTTAANRLALLFVESAVSAGTPNAPTVTGASLTWVQVASIAFGTTRRITVLRAMRNAGGSGTLSIAFGGQLQSAGIKWTLLELDGVDTTGTNGSGAAAASNTASGSGALKGSVDAGTITDGNQQLVVGFGHSTAEGSSCSLPELADFVAGDPLPLAVAWGGEGIDDTAVATWPTSSSWGAVGVIVQPSTLLGSGPTDWPTPILEFSTSKPGDAAPVWVSIVDDLIGYDVGHQRAFELDAFETSQHVYDLDNSAGSYRISNTGSTYYGQWRLMRRIRFGFQWKGRRYWKADGFIESCPPVRAGVEYATVKVTAIDAFDLFAHRDLVPSSAVLTTGFGSNADLTFTARGAAGAYRGSGGGSVYLGGLQSVGGPGGSIGIVYDSSNPDRTSPVEVQVDESTFTITAYLYTTGGTIKTQAENLMRAIIGHRLASSWVDVTLAPGSTGKGIVQAMARTPLQGAYPQELTGTRINRALDSIAWLLGRDIGVGTQQVQSVTFERSDHVKALGHFQDVQRSEIGANVPAFFVDGRGRPVFHDANARSSAPFSTVAYVLSDDPDTDVGALEYAGMLPVDDTQRLYNGISASRNNGGTVYVVDATSQDDYMPRDFSISTILASDAALTTIANSLLTRYKTPKTRYETVAVRPTRAADPLFDAIMAIDVSTRLTIKEHPPGSAALSTDVFVEGYRLVSNDVRADPYDLTVTYPLSPV